MPSTMIRPILKQTFDWSTAAAAQTVTLFTAKGIDVSQFVEAAIVIRFHSATVVQGGGTGTPSFNVIVTPDAPTAEDPALDFLGAAQSIPTVMTTAPAVGYVVLTAVIKPFGGFLRLTIHGVQGTTVWTTLKAVVSVDVIAKS